MEDFKIKINSNLDSKEAVILAESIGYKMDTMFKQGWSSKFCYLTLCDDMSAGFMGDCQGISNIKEITLPQLRDLVVLKRGDVKDATHTGDHGSLWYLGDEKYGWRFDLEEWELDAPENKMTKWGELKPIEKTMKDYLVKDNITDKYCLIKHEGLDANGFDVIELPKGTELVVQCKDGTKEYFKDGCFREYCSDKLWHHVSIPFAHIEESKLIWLKDGCQAYWDPKYSSKLPSPFNYIKKKETVSSETNREETTTETEYLLQGKNGEHLKESISELKQPEALPFIDDEPTLNDQYAEIEKVRQSAWDKQEGGNHYKDLTIQPMQYALANKLDYAQANVVKYVTRHANKNGKEDLLKAIHNIELMIEHYYG